MGWHWKHFESCQCKQSVCFCQIPSLPHSPPVLRIPVSWCPCLCFMRTSLLWHYPNQPLPLPLVTGQYLPGQVSSNTELKFMVLSLSEFSLLYISRWIIRVYTSSNQDVSQVAHSALLLFAACLETDYLLHLHSCRPQHLKTQTFNVENDKMLKFSETIVFVYWNRMRIEDTIHALFN